MTGRRGQRGQSLVLAAIMVTVLIGFTGLAVDGGAAASQQQLVRNAADGAALAAALDIFVNANSTAAATILAGTVVTTDKLPIADLAMTYLDSGGASTAVTASVVTVRAVVADREPTFFLGALGIPNFQVTAKAEAQSSSSSAGSAACGICTILGSGTDINTGTGATITVTGGGVVVDSTSAGNINLRNNAHLTAPSTVIAGGSVTLGAGASITPAAVVGAAQADPFSSLVQPAVAGVAAAYTAPAGSSTISAGVYTTITVNAGSTLTLNPGIYVLTGGMTIAGGTVNGNGVTLFLACATYPTACSVGATGAAITMSSGSLTLTPSGSGTYAGMTVFADRNNKALSSVSTITSLSLGGTFYGLAMPFHSTHPGDTLAFGQLVVASLDFANNNVVTVTRSGTLYGVSTGVKLSL